MDGNESKWKWKMKLEVDIKAFDFVLVQHKMHNKLKILIEVSIIFDQMRDIQTASNTHIQCKPNQTKPSEIRIKSAQSNIKYGMLLWERQKEGNKIGESGEKK